MPMLEYFKTPDIDMPQTRTKDGKTEKSLAIILLEKIDEMIEKGIPLTKTKLSRETGIGGNSFKTYSAIFNDTINMIRMFELGTKDKNGRLANVPNFDELHEMTKLLIQEHVAKIDRLCALDTEIQQIAPGDDNIYSRNEKLMEDTVDSYWGYLGETSLIHDDFSGCRGLDDIDHLIEERYAYNQTLRERLSELKKQVAKERELLKSRQK